MIRRPIDSETYRRMALGLYGPVLAGFEKEHCDRGGKVPVGAERSGYRMKAYDIFDRFDNIFGGGDR